MSLKDIIFTSVITFFIGLFISLWYKEFIIFRFPAKQTLISGTPTVTEKKVISLYFFKNNHWSHEKIDVIQSDDIQENIARIVTIWLQLLEEEGIIKKKITVEAVIVSPNGQDAYISLDRNPFEKSASTFEKWHLIEAMLKTIKESNLSIQKVYIQVHHQPLHDYHLDFSNPWPIEGFIK